MVDDCVEYENMVDDCVEYVRIWYMFVSNM